MKDNHDYSVFKEEPWNYLPTTCWNLLNYSWCHELNWRFCSWCTSVYLPFFTLHTWCNSPFIASVKGQRYKIRMTFFVDCKNVFDSLNRSVLLHLLAPAGVNSYAFGVKPWLLERSATFRELLYWKIISVPRQLWYILFLVIWIFFHFLDIY